MTYLCFLFNAVLKSIKYPQSWTDGRKTFFLFIDALNTFYLWLYDVGHMTKDHSDSDRGNPLPLLRHILQT